MYRTIQDFLTDWNQEISSTMKVYKNLTDASLNQKVSTEGRSLGHLAWHIVLTLGEMGEKAGLKVNAPPENTPTPNNVLAIIEAYEKAGSSLATEIKQKWDDGCWQKKFRCMENDGLVVQHWIVSLNTKFIIVLK